MKRINAHLLPALVLVVVLSVSPGPSKQLSISRAAQGITVACQTRMTQDCLAQQFSSLTSQERIRFAFATLEELQKTNPQSQDCHFIAHSIAATEVSKNPSRWREILNKECPSTCSYGCSHGVLEAYYTLSSTKLTDLSLSSLCDTDSPPACPHGLGHLLLVETRGDLGQAIHFCESLPHVKDQRYQCLTGIFMEWVTPTNLSAHGVISSLTPGILRINELTQTCQKLSGLVAWSCWKEISPPILEKNQFNPQTILSYCPTLPDLPSRSECQQRMIDVSAWKANYNLDQLSDICAISQETEFTKFCLAKLVESVAENAPQLVSNLVTFCLKQNPKAQSSCLGQISPSLGKTDHRNQSALAKSCGKLDDLLEICRTGQEYDFKPYLRDL